MKNLLHGAAGATALALFFIPLLANAFSLSIQNLSPGNTVMAKNDLTFKIVGDSAGAYTYQFADSFGPTSASVNNISGNTFSWNPLPSDVGTHTFTITATSYADGAVTPATITQTITVLPAPS